MGRVAVLACAGLAGCALFPTIEPGTTPESQILATYGQPTRRWTTADGDAVLEYATQPAGVSCFMVTVGPDGRVRNVRDALSDTNLARVQVGMDPSTVDRLLGRHRGEAYFPRTGETVWEWNIPSMGPGIATRFDVYFKEGRVSRTGRDFIYGRWDAGVVFRPPAYLPCPRCQP